MRIVDIDLFTDWRVGVHDLSKTWAKVKMIHSTRCLRECFVMKIRIRISKIVLLNQVAATVSRLNPRRRQDWIFHFGP